MYNAVQERIDAYDQEILRKLGEMEREEQLGKTAPPLNNPNKARGIKKRGQEPRRQALYRMSGVDITQIDAIAVETVEVVMVVMMVAIPAWAVVPAYRYRLLLSAFLASATRAVVAVALAAELE